MYLHLQPYPRRSSAVVYDVSTNRIVQFGGVDDLPAIAGTGSNLYFDDVWAFSLNTSFVSNIWLLYFHLC
jgi:hypothetical protein